MDAYADGAVAATLPSNSATAVVVVLPPLATREALAADASVVTPAAGSTIPVTVVIGLVVLSVFVVVVVAAAVLMRAGIVGQPAYLAHWFGQAPCARSEYADPSKVAPEIDEEAFANVSPLPPANWTGGLPGLSKVTPRNPGT